MDPGLLRDDGVVGLPVFIADPPEARIAVALESLVAVFHVPSGTTHLLAPPAPEILEALSRGPADAGTLVARLTEYHDLGDDDVQGAIAARLDELEASGLVRRA